MVGVWGLKIGYFFLLVPIILWRCPFDARERDLLVTVLMSTGAVCAALGVAQQLAGPDALHALGYPYNETIRFSGGFMRSFSTFPQPFAFGLFLSMVLLVCLPVAMGDVRRPRNCFFLALTPLIAVGMASSVVRGAILGTAVGLVVLLVRRHHGLVHLAAPAAALVLVLPTAVLGAFLSSSSLDERTTGWGGIGTIVLSAPFGNGLGTTGAAAEKSLSSGAGTADVLMMDGERYQPDSQYVKVLLELGPIGLWLLLVLLVAASPPRSAQLEPASGADRALAEGVAASRRRRRRGIAGLDLSGDLPARLLLLALPGSAAVPRSTIHFNALALRPAGSGVQTYISELLMASRPLTRARLVAHVQRDVLDRLPSGVEAATHPVADGLRRAGAGALMPPSGDLVHGLDVDVPWRSRGPRVTTIHDLSVYDVPWAFSRARGTAERFLVSRAIRVADTVVAVSDFTADRVRARFGRECEVTPLAPRAVSGSRRRGLPWTAPGRGTG